MACPSRLRTSLAGAGFVFALLISASVSAARFELMEATIADINKAYDDGSITAERLVKLYLDRIEAYDKQGPEIHAIISLNPNALKQARALDRERRKQGPRSLLHGIPVIIKDNYDTADMPTTAGSVLLKDSIPPDDAFVVKQLRDAGAIIIGKANMSEFALSFDRLSYSSLGGLTRNPYNLKRNASGSSSGSAAAVAANFAVFATGSDTAGCGIHPRPGQCHGNGRDQADTGSDQPRWRGAGVPVL